MPEMPFKHSLDTKGLICPEPVMMLHGAVRDADKGDIIRVIATDPSTERDIAKFCQFLGHTLQHKIIDEQFNQTIHDEHHKTLYTYFIEKG